MIEDIEFSLLPILEGEDKSSPFANRIRKNYRHIRKWAKRTRTNCFRIYDREIPNYPLAIDYYNGRFCVHYFSRAKENGEPPQETIDETSSVLNRIFGVEEKGIYWRTRMRSKKTRQYEKQGDFEDFFTVQEYGVKFQVDLVDYVDTGLFLDHRETRRIVASLSKGKRLLNLFAYTCSFSIHAAMSGAAFTKSVDMSNTYTNWGKENFLLNGLPLSRNEIIRADCLKFLDEEILSKNRYDLIVIDPPTISRSKKMERLFDIQEDYHFLISRALKLLLQDGVIFFSTNSRKFVLDETLFPFCSIKEISHQTHPLDFHDPKIHRCWKIQ